MVLLLGAKDWTMRSVAAMVACEGELEGWVCPWVHCPARALVVPPSEIQMETRAVQ